MTETFTFTEPTTALRDFLRSLLDDDVVFAGGLPKNTTDGVVITRIGGSVDVLDDGLYQLDCWSTRSSQAAALAGRVVTALAAAPRQTIGDELVFCGLGAVSVLSLSDPTAPDRYRTVVTAEIPTLTIT